MIEATRAHAAALGLLVLAGCARVPSALPPAVEHPVYALHAPPADDVQLETRGRLRPQYRAAGFDGRPLPYEDAVDSSLIFCAALGPLFGACAGVLIGGLAVAGVAESVVAEIGAPGSAQEDGDTLRQAFAPNVDYASVLGSRVAAATLETMAATGDRAGAGADCAAAVAAGPPTSVTGIDVVRLEVEFEPGYHYRLVLVTRLRGRDCRAGTASPERRVAWRGRLVPLARDPTTARARFDEEIANAVAGLGADIAAVLTGRPRPSLTSR